MAGISAAQAKLLAEGYLDSIGSDSGFVAKESTSALIDLAALLITEAQSILSQQGHVSSGGLSDSIKIQNPQFANNSVTLNIEALFYYQFLNKGVRGTKKGSGQFSFKNDSPSRSMVSAIDKWIKKAGLSSFNVKKSVSNTERKNKSVAQINRAYIVARSIKQKGIRASYFFDKAVSIAQQYAKEKLGTALRVDIINSIPTELNNGKSNNSNRAAS